MSGFSNCRGKARNIGYSVLSSLVLFLQDPPFPPEGRLEKKTGSQYNRQQESILVGCVLPIFMVPGEGGMMSLPVWSHVTSWGVGVWHLGGILVAGGVALPLPREQVNMCKTLPFCNFVGGR